MCVKSSILEHNFVQCGWIATKLEIVIPRYGILFSIASDITYICQGRRNVKLILNA